MAAAASQPPQVPDPRRRPILRCIAIVFLILIALIVLSVLVSWVAIRPKRLIYTVETALVENFTLSKNHLNATFENHLNATFDFVISAYNPNSKVSIYYGSMEVSVACYDQTIAFGVVQPFFQPHRNKTLLDTRLSTQYVTLYDQVSKSLTLEKNSGKIGLHIWIKAKIRFKVGLWKSRDRTLRVSCSPVAVQISKTKSNDPTHCSVEL